MEYKVISDTKVCGKVKDEKLAEKEMMVQQLDKKIKSLKETIQKVQVKEG